MARETNWWEITTSDNVRPGHPEDNTIIVTAYTMDGAIQLYRELLKCGKLTISGDVKVCRQIYHVIDIDITELKASK